MSDRAASRNSYQIDGEEADVEAVRARVEAERKAAAARSRATGQKLAGASPAAITRRPHRAMDAGDRAAKAQVRARQTHERQQTADTARLLRDDRRRRRKDEQEGLLGYRVVADIIRRAEARTSGPGAKPMVTVERSGNSRPLPYFRPHKPSTDQGGKRSAGSPQLDIDGLANVTIKIWAFGDSGGKSLGGRAFARKVGYITDPLGLDGVAAEAVMTNMADRHFDGRYPVPGGEGHGREMINLCDAISEFERDVARTVKGEATAQHFTHMMIALPAGLTRRQRRKILVSLTERFDTAGVPYASAMHAPSAQGDQRNYHVHIVASSRHFRHVPGGGWQFALTKAAGLTDPEGLRTMRDDAAYAFNRALAENGMDARYTALTRAERGLDPRVFDDAQAKAETEQHAAAVATARARLAELGRLAKIQAGLLAAMDRFIAVRDRVDAVHQRLTAVVGERRLALDGLVDRVGISGRASDGIDRATRAVQLRRRRLVQAGMAMQSIEDTVGSPQSIILDHMIVTDQRRLALDDLQRRMDVATDLVAAKMRADLDAVRIAHDGIAGAGLRFAQAPERINRILVAATVGVAARLASLDAIARRIGVGIPAVLNQADEALRQRQTRLARAKAQMLANVLHHGSHNGVVTRNTTAIRARLKAFAELRQRLETASSNARMRASEVATIVNLRKRRMIQSSMQFRPINPSIIIDSHTADIAERRDAHRVAANAFDIVRSGLVALRAEQLTTARAKVASGHERLKAALSGLHDAVAARDRHNHIRLQAVTAPLANARHRIIDDGHARLAGLGDRFRVWAIDDTARRLAPDQATKPAPPASSEPVTGLPITSAVAVTASPIARAGQMFSRVFRKVFGKIFGTSPKRTALVITPAPLGPDVGTLPALGLVPPVPAQLRAGQIAFALAKHFPGIGDGDLARLMMRLDAPLADKPVGLIVMDDGHGWHADDVEGARCLLVVAQSPHGMRFLAALAAALPERDGTTFAARLSGKIEDGTLKPHDKRQGLLIGAYMRNRSSLTSAQRVQADDLICAVCAPMPRVAMRSPDDESVWFRRSRGCDIDVEQLLGSPDGKRMIFDVAAYSAPFETDGWTMIIPPKRRPVAVAFSPDAIDEREDRKALASVAVRDRLLAGGERDDPAPGAAGGSAGAAPNAASPMQADPSEGSRPPGDTARPAVEGQGPVANGQGPAVDVQPVDPSWPPRGGKPAGR